ncbi:two-CW domain-containing protein [Thermodesulfobacteriota bacterium]
MERKNCWEVKKCGRQLGGENAAKMGVCPAAEPSEYDGTNKGTGAGRFCWAIAGTYCDGKTQGTFAMKLLACINCKFLKQVNEEEGRDFILNPKGSKSKSEKEA